MKIERKRAKGAEVYTSSLNDIMFFLLLFFLIISTMATPMAIKVMLPKSSTSEHIATKKNIEMSITHDRRYFIEGSEVAFSDIEPTLAKFAGNTTGESRPSILLQLEKTVDIQTAISVLDIGNHLDIKVVIIVEKE